MPAAARRRHSGYRRTLADLPWSGLPVRLDLQVRRFFCDNQACAQRIFTERISTIAVPYGRRTVRLSAWFTAVAFSVAARRAFVSSSKAASPPAAKHCLAAYAPLLWQPARRPACSPWMTLPCVVVAGTARSWSILRRTAWWTYCLIAPPMGSPSG